MDINKWQNVIIEWINCLNLTKKLKSVEDLKNEEFFKELFKFLAQKDNAGPDNTVVHITDFLKKHYPAYSLDNESPQIQDSIEITYAYSLLLHYCCMIDCREQFIIPLCKELSYVSQLSIKNFLQDLQSSTEITRDLLRKAILNTFSSSFDASFNSPKISSKTPLMEYLKTPHKKPDNYEIHLKKIEQLRSQLDFERFEKADLQEELHLQYEKNKKLDKNIADKQTEINRLRSELLSLENQTPPVKTNSDADFKNKLLRDEILSLEKYVKIIHKEQEELQTERDKARQKLRNIEEQSNEWQGKAIEAEKQTIKLLEENKTYFQELVVFRERCEELSTLLQELNPKKPLDESFDFDAALYDSRHNKSGSIVDCENLAHTVVDVRLIEEQENNKMLKSVLTELEINFKKVTAQKDQLEIEVSQIKENNKSLHENNYELNKKVLLLIETQKQLEDTQIKLKESANTLLETKADNENLNSIIEELKYRLLDFESSLALSKKKNDEMANEMQIALDKSSKEIEKLNLELKTLSTDKEGILLQLNESIQKAVQYESTNKTLTQRYEKFNSEIEDSLIKFKDQVKENLTDEFRNDTSTVCKLRKLVDALEIKNIKDIKTISQLQTNCHTLSNKVSELEEAITQLNIIDVKTKKEIDQLKGCLKESEYKIEHYEKEVLIDYNNVIEKYKLIIQEKSEMISELTKLNDVVIEKDNNIKTLQKEKVELVENLETLQSTLINEKQLKENLNSNCERMKNIITEKDSFIKAIEMEKYNLQNNIELLNQQLLSELNNIQELDKCIAKLKDLNVEKEQHIALLQNEKSCLQKNLEISENETTHLKKYQDELETKYKNLNDTLIIKDNCIQDLETRNDNMSKQLQKLDDDINDIKKVKDMLETNCENMTKAIEEKIIQLGILEIKIVDLNTQMNGIQQELLNTQTEKNELEDLYCQTKQSVTEKIKYIEDLENEKVYLRENIEELSNELKLLEEDLSVEKRIKEELNNECKLVKEDLVNEILKNKDINNQYILAKRNHETESLNLQNKMEEQAHEIEKLQNEIDSLYQNIETINTDIINISGLLNMETHNLQTKETTIKNINLHLTNIKEQLTLALAEKEETCEEIKSYQQKLAYCENEYETYKKQLENIIEDINMNLTLQMEIKNQESSQEFMNKADIEEDLETLENLKQSHLEEQEKGREMLGDMGNKISLLKCNIFDLVNEKRRTDGEINTLQKQFKILDNLKSCLEKRLEKHSTETSNKISALNDQCENLKSENAIYSSKLNTYRDKLNDAHISISETQVSIEELIKTHSKELESNKNIIQNLEEKNNTLEEQLQHLTSSEQNLKQEIESLKCKLKDAVTEYNSTVELQENTKHQQEREVVKLNKKLKKSIDSFEQIQKTLLETSKQLETSNREVQMYKTLSENLEKSCSDLKQQNIITKEKYDIQINALVSEKDKLQEEIQDILKDLRKTKDKLKVEKTKYKNVSHKFSNERLDLDNRLKNFTIETEKLEDKIKSLKNKLESVEKERQELDILHKDFIKTTDLKIEEIKNSHQQEIDNLEAEINKLNLKLEDSLEQVNVLETIKNEFSLEIKSLISSKEAFLEKVRIENSQLQQNINILIEDKNLLSIKLTQITDDFEKLRFYNDDNTLRYEKKLEEIDDTKKKLSYALQLIENISTVLESELKESTDKFLDIEESLIQTKEMYSNDQEIKESLSTKVHHEIINLKVHINGILERKRKLEQELKFINDKISDIEEQKKLESISYEIKYQELIKQNEEQLNCIQSQNNEIIDSLKNTLLEKDDTLKDKLTEIESLNCELLNKITEIEKLSETKSNLTASLRNAASCLSNLKLERNELIESQTNISKVIEENILLVHESVENIKTDFIRRLTHAEKEHENEIKLKKQLENFLEAEKCKVEFLEKSVLDLTNQKEKLNSICSSCFTHIHNLYTNIFEGNLDNDITQEINKVKQHQLELEDKLQSFYLEKEIIDKEYDLITNELVDLKKMRYEMSNFELVKSDYSSLKNKYDLLSVCETENNAFKLKISELEGKLSDLQLENSKYQKIITNSEVEISTFKSEISQLEKKLSDLQFENSNCQKTISDRQLDYNNLKIKCEEEMKILKKACSNWQQIIDDKDSEISISKQKYEAQIEQFKSFNLSLEENIKELKENIRLNEEILHNRTNDYDILNQKYELMSQTFSSANNEILDLKEKIAKYKNIITELEHDNININKNYTEITQLYKALIEKCNQDADNKVDKEEVTAIRSSYTNLMAENSRLQLDCTVLRKTIEERNNQLSELSHIKETYEKLLEDNNKTVMELDTLRYKRIRDKETFKALLEEERSKSTTNFDAQIKEMRNEYEEKLNKMKEKIVHLYREEIEKEKKKVSVRQQEQTHSEGAIQSLKSQLWITGNKYMDLKKENEKLREKLRCMKENMQFDSIDLVQNDFRGSRESMTSLKENRAIRNIEERRISTLPKDIKCSIAAPIDIIEESVTFSRRRRSFAEHGLKMEDEEDELFNNTYLSDLKAGRCIEPGRESVSNRMSELQYRNSLCPPHLKSSYPAETQFQSPGQFKEEDLKMGTVELDDSMSSSLLPGEKPRMKKDWGQTMYKKPGPPTPSKNGGRLSLQGNEVHPRDVLREHNDNKTQGSRGVSTPNRIKSLFTRRSVSHRNDSEVGKKNRSFHPPSEHSLVPYLYRPEPVRFSPPQVKVYHVPHTFTQLLKFNCSNSNLKFVIVFLLVSTLIAYFCINHHLNLCFFS